MSTTSPLPRLLRSDSRDPARARDLQRAFRAGRLHRLRQGVFVDQDAWSGLSAATRHRVLVRSVVPDIPCTAALSHRTAAVLLSWPIDPPDAVHVSDPATRGTLHRAGRIIHGRPRLVEPPPWTYAGVHVSSVLDTAIQISTTEPPEVAVIAVGHAVRSRTLELQSFLAALPTRPMRGSVRARTVADALDPSHESPGEDYTSFRLRELGFVRVVPQAEFHHDDGSVDRVDFWLPDVGVVVEFDGRQKYEDEEMLRGRAPREAVWHEKIREDRLRAVPAVRTVVRVRWWHLVDSDRLLALFRTHRVPIPR